MMMPSAANTVLRDVQSLQSPRVNKLVSFDTAEVGIQYLN